MGINDRDYYREEGPSFLGSISNRGKVVKWIIGATVVAFLFQVIEPRIQSALILDAVQVLSGQVWRLLTCALLHDPENPFHILFNMLLLWWFGKDIEDIYGHAEFFAIYVGSAILGSVFFTLTHMNGGLALGASAAVTAVMVLAAFHFPNRTLLLFFIIPCPIWLAVALYVGFDALYFLTNTQTGVAVSGHLGGAAFGFMYYKFQWRLTGWWKGISWPKKKNPHLRIYEEEPEERVPVSVMAASAEEEQLEAKMDQVLTRLSEVGRENLTQEEKDILERASELYKRRQR